MGDIAHCSRHRGGDDADHDVDLVPEGQPFELGETRGRLSFGIGQDQLDGTSRHLATKVVEAHLQGEGLVIAESGEDAGGG